MRAPQRHVVEFTWDKGEFGNLGAREAGKLGGGWFTARNLVRYRTGLLGPRSGVRPLGVTGVPNGVLVGFGWAGTTGDDLWFAVGTTVYTVDAGAVGNAAQAATGSLDSTPTRRMASLEVTGGFTYMTSLDDNTYKLDHAAGTLTKLASSPGGSAVCAYGERLIVAGNTANPNRVWYSAAGDFTSWPAANYFDVGSGAAVRAVFSQRGHLTILLQNGEWWVLTGVPGATGVLRRVSGGGVHPWHLFETMCALLGDDRIVFVPLSGDYPAVFSGAQVAEQRHLSFTSSDVTPNDASHLKVSRGVKPEEVAVFSGTTPGMAMLYRNGVWTFHDLDVSSKAWVASDGQAKLFVSDGGAGGSAATFWFLPLVVDRPAFTSDGYGRPGDGSDTPHSAYVHFPEYWDGQGRELLVKSVIVDFEKWNTGSATANNMTCQVDALDMMSTEGARSSSSQSWTEAGSESSTDGDTYRHIFEVGDQGVGSGFQVKLTALKGVALRRVAVEVVVEPNRAG